MSELRTTVHMGLSKAEKNANVCDIRILNITHANTFKIESFYFILKEKNSK